MLATYSIKLQPRVVEKIDELVEANVCPSRNEFLREAAVKHLRDLERLFFEWQIGKDIEKFKAGAKRHPKSPFMTKKEKDEVFEEFCRKKGFKVTPSGLQAK